ncbi:MAG: aspartate aminotransferase family protein [Acidobacteriaceae bacterium]
MATASVAKQMGTSATKAYEEHVNPQWVRLLELLEMNQQYERCQGEELFTRDGRRILDFLSGYCVYNAGHNHPAIVQAVRDELGHDGPSMLQSHVSELAGELAGALCSRAGGKLNKAYFCSSGSEGVETVIKFARAYTKRSGLLYARGAFHGLTCGALSLMDNGFWSEGFGPMLPHTEAVDFGNLEQLKQHLSTKKFAALVLEPMQGEGGIRIPSKEYLQGAQELCRKYGTLFVLDEVQTGLYRTGKFLAAHHYGITPDMVVLAKALSGGLIPVGAVLMTDEIYDSVYGSLRRAIVHTSTYSENALAMRAGLATLQALEKENMGPRAEAEGEAIRAKLRTALEPYEMVEEVRGAGFFSGIVFRTPRQLQLRLAFESFKHIHEGMFGQMLVMRMFKRHDILTQICGNNFLVLKMAPPLNAKQSSLDAFVDGITEVMEAVHSSRGFWSDALSLAKRAVKI